jgi:hypothetical protein
MACPSFVLTGSNPDPFTRNVQGCDAEPLILQIESSNDGSVVAEKARISSSFYLRNRIRAPVSLAAI